MALDITTTDGITIVTLVRRLDADSAPAVEAELKKALAGPGQRVLFDFSGTDYIASAGLRVLLSTTRTVLKNGGAVALAALTPQVRQVFEIAGFTQIFTICATRDEAFAVLKK